MKRNPDQKIVGTKWVLTEKVIEGKQGYKAKLVVQGCQEDKGYIRTNAPTEASDAFFMTLAAAAQDGWDCNGFDAQSACLQSDGIEKPLLLRMPHTNQSPGTKPTRVCCSDWFNLRDARCWTCLVRAQ